jgi:hypothetical protein
MLTKVNRGDEDLCRRLRAVWQGLQSTDQTFDEEVACEIDEIRQLLDDESLPNQSDDTTSSPEEVA